MNQQDINQIKEIISKQLLPIAYDKFKEWLSKEDIDKIVCNKLLDAIAEKISMRHPKFLGYSNQKQNAIASIHVNFLINEIYKVTEPDVKKLMERKKNEN